MSKEKLSFWGGVIVLFIVVCILVALFVYPIPKDNNDILKVIIGIFVSTLTMVIYSIVGKDTSEIDNLKKENYLLREKNRNLSDRVDHLERMFQELQEKVIDKLSILAGK